METIESLKYSLAMSENYYSEKIIKLLEAKILHFQAKYKNEMSPNLHKEYMEFFGIQRCTEGRIN
jgi:hypothetical protein